MKYLYEVKGTVRSKLQRFWISHNQYQVAKMNPESYRLVFVEDIMSEDAVTVGPDEPVGKIASRMAENGIHRVVVVDKDQFPLGIITSLDVLRAFGA